MCIAAHALLRLVRSPVSLSKIGLFYSYLVQVAACRVNELPFDLLNPQSQHIPVAASKA